MKENLKAAQEQLEEKIQFQQKKMKKKSEKTVEMLQEATEVDQKFQAVEKRLIILLTQTNFISVNSENPLCPRVKLLILDGRTSS